jgi:thioredoxin reductase (NADPH)
MQDVIIIGGGPGGLAAGIYGGRYTLDTVVLTEKKGGLIINAKLLENYPGCKRLSGYTFMKGMEEHVKDYGVPIREEKVVDIQKKNGFFQVKTENQGYKSKTLVMATGRQAGRLNIPGEKKFEGKGVAYCATCDGALFAGKDVAVVGCGHAAGEAAMILCEYASKVYLLSPKKETDFDPVVGKRLEESKKVKVLTGVKIKEIKGKQFVDEVVLDNGGDLEVKGVFIETEKAPSTELAKRVGVELNEKGEIMIDKHARTSVPGVFAAGDVTDTPYKQAVVAAACGATAAWSAYLFLKEGGKS